MALLGTYLDAGAASLASGLTCFSHSLPTIPDFATFQVLSSGANSSSIPIFLESRAATLVVWRNGNGGGVNGEQMLIFAHSIIR